MTQKSIILTDVQADAAAKGRLTQVSVPVTVPWGKRSRCQPYDPYYVEADGRLSFMDEYGDFHPMESFGTYRVGTVLVGRESVWLPPPITNRMLREGADTWPEVIYDADVDDGDRDWCREMRWRRRSSAVMPRKYARHRWTVTEVSVRRVGNVTPAEAAAHGIEPITPGQLTACHLNDYVYGFQCYWQSRHGKKYPWPSAWVWVRKLKPEKV